MHTIVPIHRSRDTTDTTNYKTIKISHMLVKLYGAVLEAKLSTYAKSETLGTQTHVGQAIWSSA